MSVEHKIPRIDPENRLGIEGHAVRALMRFENIDPATRRAAIEGAAFRNEGVHLGEADKMRAAMLKMLNRLEGRRTPEQEQLLKLLSRQIEPALRVWQGKPGIDMQGAPTKDGMQGWIDGLTEQTLDSMLEYKEPRIVVVPPVLTTQLLEMIGGRNSWPDCWNGVKVSDWRFGVTDGVEDMDCDPTIFYINPNAPEDKRIKRTNEQMVLEHKRRFQANGQDLMPQYAYVPAATRVMAEGKVLDKRNYAAFERKQGTLYVPGASFDSGRVELNSYYPQGSSGDLRCRPWVEGA